MKTATIYQDFDVNESTLDDFVFKNKNKAYGAYYLRMSYLKTINRSFFIGSVLFILGLAVPTIFAKYFNGTKEVEVTLPPMTKVDSPPTNIPPPIVPPPVESPKVATVALLPPVIVLDPPIEVEIPEQKEFEKAVSASITQVGESDAVEIPIDETIKKPEIVDITPVEKDEIVIVEQQAEFMGGNSAMSRFLQKNLNYPAQAQRANVSGKVFLSFVVDKNGEISDVSVIKGIGFGCDEEALRVVRLMPKWSPGKQSGRAVKSRFNLPVSFVLQD